MILSEVGCNLTDGITMKVQDKIQELENPRIKKLLEEYLECLKNKEINDHDQKILQELNVPVGFMDLDTLSTRSNSIGEKQGSLANAIELIDNSDLVKFQELIKKNPELLAQTDDFGFSILSAIIEKGDYAAKAIVMDTKIASKQPLSEEIEPGLINASRQFHMEMSEIRDLVGHVFEGCDDWGII